MTANELRIGNYVYSQIEMEVGKYVPVKVVAINENRIAYLTPKKQHFPGIRPFDALIGQIHGIPVTEDWLLNFGLNENRYSDRISRRFDLTFDGRFVIRLDNGNMPEISFEGNTMVYIDYVHQLQNLYFALTGAELEIKS